MRELLALSCEAVKRGIANKPTNKTELSSIRSEVVAVSYDIKVRKVKTDPPFAWITDAQLEKFYSIPARETEFERFFDAKVEIMRRSDPNSADRVPTDEERNSAREFFASIKIAETAAAILPEPFKSEVGLRVKMQQAQFLARLLAESLMDDIHVTDKQVSDYIAANPVYSDETKRAAAAKILARAIAGEDFASLANEYSEDPGNVSADGKKNGGLYADVPLGMMVPPFEKATLALKPGQISPDLVKSDFGFHVIKLEKKTADGSKYDVRHILILTGFKDPNDPSAREVPAAVFVRTKLEAEREDAVMKKIIAQNAIVVEEYNPTAAVPAKRPVAKRRRA
jgi:parvulin-like peptidyl-prolyl isomerase